MVALRASGRPRLRDRGSLLLKTLIAATARPCRPLGGAGMPRSPGEWGAWRESVVAGFPSVRPGMGLGRDMPCLDAVRHYKVGDELGRLVVERWRDVAVDAEGDGDRRVAEALLDNARVDATFKGEGGPGVP